MHEILKRLAAAMALVLSLVSAVKATGPNPVANPQAVVTDGLARFTVLTPEVIRIEYAPSGNFEDNATFAVINRDLPVPEFSSSDDGKYLSIVTPRLSLRYRKGADLLSGSVSPEDLSVTMSLNGEEVVWYPGKEDTGNLKGTYRTLDSNNGDSHRRLLENGVVSRDGWAVIDDSPKAQRADGSRSLAFTPAEGYDVDWVTPRADGDALDLYFFGHGHDYKRALKDFTLLSGSIPLPPDYVFGYWYSKFDEYSSQDFMDIVESLEKNDINADVMILDVDWHWNGDPKVSDGRGGWTGWSWNTKLIPDPEGLLSYIKAHGLHSALNLHPADGVAVDEDQYPAMARDLGLDSVVNIPWNLEDKKFAKAFFKNIIHPLEKQGVDFWWLDWQQHLVNPRFDGLGETFWCNHVFFNDMKNYRKDRRPVIFHRWGGLGSHRYQIGFSGDTYINYPTLAFEPYFTATASNVGYGYWGHDLGGHMVDRSSDVVPDPNDPDRLLRWMQFGVFTPIFRTHATKAQDIERRIWTYDNLDDLRATVKLRYALFPYIYTMARKAYETGVSICRPMYYEYPEKNEAYDYEGQYFFGDDILVAPIVEAPVNGKNIKSVWLPEGKWWSVAHNRLLDGDKVVELEYTLSEIPYFYREGAVMVNNPASVRKVTERPSRLILKAVAGADGRGVHYEDSGDSNNYDTEFAKTDISLTGKKDLTAIEISPREGKYEGMPLTRGYDLEVFNTTMPKAVKINGTKADFTYDPTASCALISTDELPCTQAVSIEILN